MSAIPEDTARRLCDQIRQANRGRWYSFYCWWCWGCVTFTGGEPAKMCFANKPGNRGCSQVNARYDRSKA